MRHAPSLVLLSLVFTGPARAQMGPMPGEERFKSLAGQEQNSAGAGVAYAQIGSDIYVQIAPTLALNFGELGIGIQVPLNVRVGTLVDGKPEFKDAGQIREEDWDSPGDYLKVIRWIRFGHKHSDDLIYARLGDLAADIGHGTIMNRYMNNLDINTYHMGSQFDVYTNYGGLETVVGDYAFGSRVVGSRLYFKPVALWDPESIFNIFALGASVITDANAPRYDDNGTPADLSDDTPSVDADGDFVVDKTRATTVWGVDVEARVLNTHMLKLTPYIDLNSIASAGWGLHLGALFEFNFPILIELHIPLRLEYRRFRSDYVPAYFSTFYELERYSYPVGEPGLPKGDAVRLADDSEGIHGVYADLALDFAGIFQLGAIYEGYEDAYPNLAAFLSVPALQIVQFKAYYSRTGISGTDDIIAFDDRSLVIAEARYQVVSYTYLVGRFSRRWVLDADTRQFEATDDWKAGVEVSFTF